ncbi:MAG TPA: LysR family transcriptional regulator [Enteractinococcus helveticum]|uniref:LysR family transcriptional regulator n=1 Tax=Enteractinococcus helveticum TaxID=1837282 RepID=A0A921K8I8_9MICC|nr:LysR family transcriptional regulator [Enteractinococcus helveticum]HJF15321.1 LysR family transcriptional regulator [Enteractinococcus helveticum]
MDERLLTAFLTVAETQNVSVAAGQLNITQPALSRQLQKLQRHLKVDLLQSHHSGVALTAAGEEFLPVAQQVVNEIRKAEAFARMLATGRFSEITFAAPGTTLIDIVIPFVATLDSSELHSHVIETPLAASLEQAVNTADLVIMPSAPPKEFASIALVELPVWAYVAPGHPWAERDEIALEELVEDRVVVTTTDFMSRRVLDGAVDVAGLTVPQIVETKSGRVAQALVAAGNGVAVVTEDAYFGLKPAKIVSNGKILSVWLHAGWRADHYAYDDVQALAARLARFAQARYPGLTPGPIDPSAGLPR